MNKQIITLVALGVLGAVSAQAQQAIFSFDGVTLDQNFGSPLPTSLSIDYAILVEEDEFGDPLDTPYYGIDPDADPVGAVDPISFYNNVSSAPNALAMNAEYQAVLFSFGSEVTITDFSVLLDDSSYGTPSFFGTAIEFYDGSYNLISSIAIDEQVPGFVASSNGPISGVSTILFASGALYDNVSFTAVPEPETYALVIGLLGLGLCVMRRRRA